MKSVFSLSNFEKELAQVHRAVTSTMIRKDFGALLQLKRTGKCSHRKRMVTVKSHVIPQVREWLYVHTTPLSYTVERKFLLQLNCVYEFWTIRSVSVRSVPNAWGD